MKKVARRGVLLGALLSFLPKSSIAASPTLVPKRVGQTIIWRGRKYTAVKIANKIVWDKGVPVVTTSPEASKSASPAPSNLASPSSSPSVTRKNNVVGKSTDLSMGETKLFSENDPFGRGARYLITRTNTGLVAYDNTCTHEGCGIETILPKNQLRCNCHGAEFNAITGAAIKKPAYDPLKAVIVSEVNGEILIG